jgi:ribosomal protein L6P/L9E
LPQGVDVAFKDKQINVKGALGALALTLTKLLVVIKTMLERSLLTSKQIT